MKKTLFPLFAVFPVVFVGAGCGGQEAKANFSTVPLQNTDLQKAKAVNEALSKEVAEANQELVDLKKRVVKLQKASAKLEARSSSLKEFKETDSFIKKLGEALKPAPEAEEVKKEEFTLPSADVEVYCAQLFQEKRDWVYREWPNLRRRNMWRDNWHSGWKIFPDYNQSGVGICYYLSSNPRLLPYLLVDSSFISNDELMTMAKSREKQALQKSPKKGKTKLL